ncbi:hypothetical protein [Flagellimonas myxillae]|uniref:hypothetical protein n=1 Tax=Flagellimonas myxillae TaxID=2942214 RepID=UPI00201F5D50|nr:hypothetical protein [Muricauda myxillae]MCL6264927.1 hypothetical protein [Muricauda myxillae]
MDKTIVITLVTSLGIPLAIELFKIVKKIDYWKKVRLNTSLKETYNEKKISLLAKITSYFFFKSVKKNHWSDENIVIVERFGNKRPEIKVTKKVLRLKIPEQYKAIIESYYPGFDNLVLQDNMLDEAQEVLEKEYSDYYSLSKINQRKNLNEIIEWHKNEVAQTFVNRLKSSKICFNNEMYGLWNYKMGKELTMEFYKTDFFTFQVFQSIHQELATNPNCGINNITDGKSLMKYRVFLCSFGINTFLVSDRLNHSEILFAKRSKYNIGAGIYKNRYHYSMNEAFSITDNSGNKSNEAFVECIKRGFNEELGIPTNLEANKTVLLDFNFSKKLMQVGISSVCYFDNFNSEDIRNCYKGAKDGRLETDDLIFIPYKRKRIKPLIYYNSIPKINNPKYKHSKHIDSLTDESRLGLFQLFARYPRVSYLKKTKAQYFDKE